MSKQAIRFLADENPFIHRRGAESAEFFVHVFLRVLCVSAVKGSFHGTLV